MRLGNHVVPKSKEAFKYEWHHVKGSQKRMLMGLSQAKVVKMSIKRRKIAVVYWNTLNPKNCESPQSILNQSHLVYFNASKKEIETITINSIKWYFLNHKK